MNGSAALTSGGPGASVTVKIISHDAHMDAFTYRHAELACEALSLSTTADAVRPLAHAFMHAPDDNSHPPREETS